MKLFNFDCFAVLADQWSNGCSAMPAYLTLDGRAILAELPEPADQPELLGFFLTPEQANGYIEAYEADQQLSFERERDHSILGRFWKAPRRTYFVIKAGPADFSNVDPFGDMEKTLHSMMGLISTGRVEPMFRPISEEDKDGYLRLQGQVVQ